MCFYGHPTLSTWFTSEYKKSGKKLDMGKGCVRFKKLEDLALDVRFAGRELYGGRPRAVASWSREVGGTVLVKTEVTQPFLNDLNTSTVLILNFYF